MAKETRNALKKLTVDDEPKLVLIATQLHDELCGVIFKGIAFFDKVFLRDVMLPYLPKHGAARTDCQFCDTQ
jgi:hypothetical protein